MKNKKWLILWITTAVALNAAEAKVNNISEIEEKTTKEISHIIQNNESKKNTIDRENALKTNNKNKLERYKDKKNEIIKIMQEADSNITNIEVDQKLKYITLLYKNTYKIKYEPKPKEGQPGSDNILLTDTTTQKTYEIEIAGSLFMKDLEPKYKKIEIQKEKIAERLQYIVKVFNVIQEKLQSDSLLFNHDEPIIMKWDKVYFSTEKKVIKNGKENFEEWFRRITYQKARKEGEKLLPEKIIIEKISSEKYFESAYI